VAPNNDETANRTRRTKRNWHQGKDGKEGAMQQKHLASQTGRTDGRVHLIRTVQARGFSFLWLPVAVVLCDGKRHETRTKLEYPRYSPFFSSFSSSASLGRRGKLDAARDDRAAKGLGHTTHHLLSKVTTCAGRYWRISLGWCDRMCSSTPYIVSGRSSNQRMGFPAN
jgi:hypothetical protein